MWEQKVLSASLFNKHFTHLPSPHDMKNLMHVQINKMKFALPKKERRKLKSMLTIYSSMSSSLYESINSKMKTKLGQKNCLAKT